MLGLYSLMLASALGPTAQSERTLPLVRDDFHAGVWGGEGQQLFSLTYHPTAIHYGINSPNPQTGKSYRN
eukprot:3588927-Amphidinium_carterae.1